MQTEELVKRAQKGDAEAFSELIILHEKRIYNIALKFMRNDADAQDAAQDAIIKMYKSIGRYSFRAAFTTWMYRVVVNACLDMLRRKTGTLAGDCPDDLQSSTGQPEDRALQRELAAAIKKAVRGLPEKYMAAFILRDVDGMKYEEIADILKISVGTVKSRLSRAREKLRGALADKGIFPAGYRAPGRGGK